MSDFTSGFWSYYIAALTLGGIAFCAFILVRMSKRRVSGDPDKTGHVWDEDLDEYNNPLPRWWVWLFWITIAFGLGYLWIYPGLGSWGGASHWSSRGQYEQEVKAAEAEYGPLYQKFAAVDIATLAGDPQARAVGHRLFLTYCTQCHASDARGGKGFPNLTDDDWLFGGSPETIQTTIMEGRNGVMPPFGPALGPEGVLDTANYVRSLSGLPHDAARAERGKKNFATYCVACHGADAKGNQAVGAPNLTDQIWLFGPSEATIVETITNGRNIVMPAHKDFLGEARVHLLAAYVYGLSHPELQRRVAEAK
ncbi:MAG TPA: cytochrome-c oxidase, cbb3-type subunit III [Usitatibacter sp.]|nr:cytochrome-c oxidase, cbb3-type subunit III [Usitatibacter sp.]